MPKWLKGETEPGGAALGWRLIQTSIRLLYLKFQPIRRQPSTIRGNMSPGYILTSIWAQESLYSWVSQVGLQIKSARLTLYLKQKTRFQLTCMNGN